MSGFPGDFQPHGGRVDEQFIAAASAFPERTAVIWSGRRVTYRELDQASARLSGYLRGRGVGPETLVGVCVDRGPGLMVALLGVLRAGGAYVPLDPSHPRERREFVIRDASLAMLLTSERDNHLEALQVLPIDAATGSFTDDGTPPAAAPVPAVSRQPSNGHAAYAIYTSGSTGRPKGVVVTHAALTNFLLSMRQRPGIATCGTMVAITTVAFDIAVLELFLPLTAGGRVVIASASDAKDPDRLAALIKAHRAGAMQATPATWRMLRLSGWSPPGGFTAMCGGEKLPPDLASWLGQGAADAWDLYGPTETTIWSSTARIGADGTPNDWQPVMGTSFHVLGEFMQPLHDGASGELYIGGIGLARGYLGRPGLTAERFLPDPFGRPGGRLYRTGDLGRRRADGGIDILGRTDHQVKIRGHRIELGEIEAVAALISGVRYTVAQPFADPAGGTRLVLFVVPEAGASPAPEELRSRLAAKLPKYMLPYRYVLLDSLPLTPNGKVDRKALRLPDESPPTSPPAGEEPTTDLEAQVVRVWAEILEVPRVGLNDDIFAAGGHSLAAAAVAARLRERLGVGVSVSDLLRCSTPASQAELIAQCGADTARPRTPHRSGGGGSQQPLTWGQQRIWLLEQIRSGSSPYATLAAYRLQGFVDADSFTRAVQEVAARHEILRARFPAHGGQPVQELTSSGRIPVVFRDMDRCDDDDGRGAILALTEEARKPFDLVAGPPMRVVFLRHGPGRAFVLFHWHHIVFDGWSLGIYMRDLARAYEAALNGLAPEWEPLPVGYAEAQALQRDELPDSWKQAQLDFWKRQLDDIPSLSTLPADRMRPAAQSSDGAQISAVIDGATADEFRKLCAASRITLYTGLLAVFALLIASYAGTEEAVIGTPVANRLRPEYEELIGFFVNTLVMRVAIGRGATLAQLFAKTKETVLDALAHAEVPFEEIVNALRPQRSLGHNPLFQVMFNLEGTETGCLRLPGVTAEPVDVHSGGSRFDLTVTVKVGQDGPLRLEAEYSTDLFDRQTIECAIRQYVGMIKAAAGYEVQADISELLRPGAEDRALLEKWNATSAGFGPGHSVHDLVLRQARQTADAVALSCGAETVTYGQLATRAQRVALALSARGIGRGDIVGVCLPREPSLAVALLGVLQSGAAYLPLDPTYPVARVASQVASAAPSAIITTAAVYPGLPLAAKNVIFMEQEGADERTAGCLPPGHPDDTAYVIHTSGSTGIPKGVCLPHRALENLIHWQNRDQLSGVRTAQLSSIGFDVHFQEIFITLAVGGTVVFAPEAARRDPQELRAWLDQTEIEQLICTPTLFEQLARACRVRGAVPAALREVTTAGEQLNITADMRWFTENSTVELHNQYGPSETHAAAAFRCPRDDDSWTAHPPIGRPIANRRIYVLDERMRPLPVGITGELFIAGIGHAGGYLRMPALTAEKFVPDPFSSLPCARMYRTGDRGRWLPSGVLEHQGRYDDQMKIRGVRIEPGEIEAQLQRHPAIREAAVAIREPRAGNRVIVAYIVPAPGQPTPVAEDLRRYLAEVIPGFAVPGFYVPMDSLPRTPSGKLHRTALPDPPLTAALPRARALAPRTPIEQWMAEAWRRELGIAEIGIHDDFFTLGGNSLLGVRLIAEMNEHFGSRVDSKDLFALATVSGLAEAAEMSRATAEGTADPDPDPDPDPDAAPAVGEHDGTAVLSSAQQAMWFLDRLHPASNEYLLPMVLELRGPLNGNALDGAIDGLCARHETLRTRYMNVDGEPRAVIDPASRVKIIRHDLASLGPAERSAKTADLLDEELNTPIELNRERPFRVRLLRLAPNHHILAITCHHIASDGHSLAIIRHELAALYNGTRLPQPSTRYTDFARQQRSQLGSADAEPLIEYWRRVLAGARPLDLPTDQRRPAVRDTAGSRLCFPFPDSGYRQVRELAREHGSTPFTVLLAGFVGFLAALTGQRDIVLGTSSSGRNTRGLQDVVGLFVNTLPLRFQLPDDPAFAELMSCARDSVVAGYAHRDLPFDVLVRELRPPRDPSRTPFVDVMFVMAEDIDADLPIEGLEVAQLPIDSRAAGFDLTLQVAERADGSLICEFEYATSLFGDDSIRRMVDQFIVFLGEAVNSPRKPLSELAPADSWRTTDTPGRTESGTCS